MHRAGRDDDDVAAFSIDRLAVDPVPTLPGLQDEDLVVRVGVRDRPVAPVTLNAAPSMNGRHSTVRPWRAARASISWAAK